MALLNARSYMRGLHCRTSHMVMLPAALNGASPPAAKIDVVRPDPSQDLSMSGSGVYRLYHGKITRPESPSMAAAMFRYLSSYTESLRVRHSISPSCSFLLWLL